ncbi:protein lin-52 homolog [Chiloscyllium plagiosum]|uniref:protein lin-52 homolog n=1 Tax=Chiloscyllium plagiosum TaxID=36176 RepID=UPI001CB80E74|nr:protein lin-52 homolog [Chiloscyllium plagiosum]
MKDHGNLFPKQLVIWRRIENFKTKIGRSLLLGKNIKQFGVKAGADLEQSLLSFEKLDRASPDLWPEQMPGVAEFAASFKSPITSSPPKWMAELEKDDIDMLKELGSLTTANLMEKVRGLQNLAYQLGLDESREMTRGKFLNILERPKKLQ